MSGYGGYYKDFSKYIYYSDRATCEISDHKLIVSKVLSKSTFIEKIERSDSYKIKVTGLKSYPNSQLWYRYYTEDNIMTFFKILNDGEYVLPQSNEGILGFLFQGINGECNITIEQIPLYPGALVLDGTDDYIALEAFDSGFKTVFMVFKPMTNINTGFYDQIKKGEKKYYFAICGGSTDIAFSYRNTNGKTYINGKLNTSVLSKDIINKTVCIGIVNENVTPDNTISPRIGNGTHYEPWYANMVIYKFLGFKEELTEEQIQAIIKKYNLLDGVDEIEVS